jgi:citrate lyase subunit beta/citryl-CoA lyase
VIPRSYLFVPADRPERFAKALASRADAVIVDLEDAVALTAKDAARDALGAWLATTDRESRIIVRINAVDTPWFTTDLALCQSPSVSAVMVPKAERAADLDCGGKVVLPLIETASGIDAVRVLARVPCVQRLVFGSIDLQLDLGTDGDGEELLMFRSQLVLASRLAGLASPVDGVCTEIGDAEQLRSDTRRARRLGFGAKLCIHPKQVEVVNAGFSPSEEEIKWARRVRDAAAQANGAAVAVGGRMIDRPVILRGNALLRQVVATDWS